MIDSPLASATAGAQTLQRALESTDSVAAYLRAAKTWDRCEPADYVPGLIIPQLPSEFSLWEREQRGWRESVALFDQSHHMNGLYLTGADTLAFLTSLACNALAHSTPGRAHQLVTCNPEGHFIGDAILFHLAPGEMFMCGAPFAVNWVRYNAAISQLDVTAEYEPRSPVYANGHGNTRRWCRYQIQGPQAWALIEKLNGGPLEDVAFFDLTELRIAGHRVQALRHGMAGAPGLEIWAPWDLRDELRGTIVEAGREFGLVLAGAMSYLSGAAESGWIANALPAVYSESLRTYREWLPATEAEALCHLTGSFASGRVEDYYVTPYDLGYDRLVDLEHDFIGRDALTQMDPGTSRRPASLVWAVEDASQLLADMLDPDGPRCKALHLPGVDGDHTVSPYNSVMMGDRPAGFGHFTAYSANERAILTLATVERDLNVGDEVVLHWGEAGGGFGDGIVPADDIRPIRCTVGPVPYSRFARTEYRAD